MMKRILLFFLLWFITVPLQSAGASAPEITMLFFYQNGCPWCARMDTILSEPEIKALLTRHDRLVRVNVHQGEKIAEMGKSGTALTRDFHIHSTPTILFIDKTDKVFLKIPGALEQEDFLDIICQYHPQMHKETLCRDRANTL